MASKSKCDRCRQPLYGLVACPACREAMIEEAIAREPPSRDPLRLDPEDPESVERLTEDLCARFDQGHFIPWDDVLAYLGFAAPDPTEDKA